jgi:hypothetical protein
MYQRQHRKEDELLADGYDPWAWIKFSSPATLNRVLNGSGVAVTLDEDVEAVGRWAWIPAALSGAERFEIRDVETDALVSRSFVENIRSVVVL